MAAPAAAVAAALSVLAAACAGARASGTGTPPGGAISHPTGPTDLILRVETRGGLLGPEAAVQIPPSFSLFGDGTVVVPGAEPMIFPGPALPTFTSFHLTEAGVQAILRAARDAGLLGPSRRVGGIGLPDVGITTVTVVAGGATHVTTFSPAAVQGKPPTGTGGSTNGSAGSSGTSAGGAAPGAVGAAEPDIATVTSPLPKLPLVRIGNFLARLGDLTTWLPKDSVGSQGTFTPDNLAVYVRSGAPPAHGGLTQKAVDWPAADSPLNAFGDPTLGVPGTRCGVVTGADAASVLAAAERANQLTPWMSAGGLYTLQFRPLLPDQHTCPTIAA